MYGPATPQLIQGNTMPHPICGKCKSSAVYQDISIAGRSIVCIMCGNRYPENKHGFYMSEKNELDNLHSAPKKEDTKIRKIEVVKENWRDIEIPETMEYSDEFLNNLVIDLCRRRIRIK